MNHIWYSCLIARCADIDECGSTPCLHGATCRDDANSYQCQCSPGFTGSFCETGKSPITGKTHSFPHPCDIEMTKSYKMMFADVDECSNDPCHNGSTCVDVINSYTCLCPSGYTGNQCQSGKWYLRWQQERVWTCVQNPISCVIWANKKFNHVKLNFEGI